MINERLLQFIWQFQYFNKQELQTADGENLEIIYCGTINKNQGPDFSEAKIKIDKTILIGNIELHIKASDWNLHEHSEDENYSNIILHVVWKNDTLIFDDRLKALPTLELQPLVSNLLLKKYEDLMHSQSFIPCEKQLPVLSEMNWLNWKERLVVERLQRKSKDILLLLERSNNHWEEIFWQMLAKNFGITVNAELFETVAKTISINVLAKHKNQIHQLEGLLLGQTLVTSIDHRCVALRSSYVYLLSKDHSISNLCYLNNLLPTAQSKHFFSLQ